MAPCARLYAYLGCQLAAARPGASHRYTRWAATYSGAQYRGWVARKERLLDRCGRGVPYGEPCTYQPIHIKHEIIRWCTHCSAVGACMARQWRMTG